MTTWKSDFVQANGIHIHYHRTGGGKPALVLLHGITDSGLAWARTARALEKDYDILMPDARGHGLSDKPQEGYRSDDYAADFAGLIEALGLGPVLVIGHSLGAINATTLAVNYPHLVRAAVLEDPPWRDQSDPQSRQSPEQSAARMYEWRERVLVQQQQTTEVAIAAGRKQSPKWHEDEFPQWVWGKQQVYPDVLTKGVLRTWDDLIPQVRCPTLLVTGDTALGAIVTPDLAQRICAANPRFFHAHIPDTGHNIRRDSFEEYTATVSKFLGGVA